MKINELNAICKLLDKFNENFLKSNEIGLLISFNGHSFIFNNSSDTFSNAQGLSKDINNIYEIFVSKDYVKQFMGQSDKSLKNLLIVIKRFYDEKNFCQFSNIEMLGVNNPCIYHYDQDGNKVEITFSENDLNSNDFNLISLNYIK